MCGITGYLRLKDELRVPPGTIEKMTACITYRGPDKEGFFSDSKISLGHRRLSIIDLEGGMQPMYNADNSLVLVLNGEIYNYIELRNELKQFGHIFKTSSDTEVVLKAFEQWGIDCQLKFNGMWAFAIWDLKNQELFLSRDRVGEKPLHYSVYNEVLVFGSELKSLREFGVPFNINPEVIELYLFLTNIPTPLTFYKNIFKLRPGHFLHVKNSEVKEKKYWDLPLINEDEMIRNKKEVNETFSSLLNDSVRIRMRCDVPFGAFLSGGLDSSSVVSLMSENSGFPIETFTIGFADKAYNESALAEKVSTQFKTHHHLSTVTPDSFDASLHRIVQHFDEPFGDSSAIPTGFVSKAAGSKVKMVLTGDGGDEILSGYNSYLGLKIAENYQRLPRFIQSSLPVLFENFSKGTKGRIRYRLNKMAGVSRTASLPFEERMVRKMAYTDYDSVKKLVAGHKVITIEDFIADFYQRYPLEDPFYKLMFFDFKHNLPDDYLAKVDRMSMAYSLEARLPFLDYRLIEYMTRVDKSVKLEGWKTKSVLRNTVAKNLPPSILKAPKKGFGIPLREWFKSDSFEQHFEELQKISWLDRTVVRQIIEENRSGKKDNGNFIWTLFVLKEFLDGNKIRAGSPQPV